MTSTFHGDRPIADEADDRFGLGIVADRLASALTHQSATKGLVLGVEGAWGSGKSSLLALMIGRLRADHADAVEVVEFRPWLVGDRDQLLSALFEDLTKAIAAIENRAGDATRSTMLAAKDVAGTARRYARHLGSAGKLAGLAGLAVPGLGIAGTVLEKLAEAAKAETDGPTLAAQKDHLADALEGLERRVVVVVDDVDRLEPKEVAELLRLVRSVADFPNVTYVLCYDGETLARSVVTATGVTDGRAYLEKIVQTEVSVPRPESFALRRLFSTELATFATCDAEVGQRLLQIIDMAGGRCFDTPRTVMRVLDSLRLFWDGLKDQVDLADLAWLRIMAVASPRTYRWVEEYLDAVAVIATGRGSVDAQERAAVSRRLDEALAADGTDWDQVRMEFHMILPRLGWGGPGEGGEDRRVFADGNQPDPAAAAARRLSSPDHSRLYFALSRAPGSVDLADIEGLIAATRKSRADAEALLMVMAEERNVSGASKAERMLDQLWHLDPGRLADADLPNLAFSLVAVAEVIGSARGEEWGQPRAWRAAKKVLAVIRVPTGEAWADLLAELFTRSPHFDILTHLLRDETFDHGLYGNRRDLGDTITTPDEFGVVRDAMFARYRELGVRGILGLERAATTLYAWSQAGGRAEVVAAIDAHVDGDDGRLVEVLATLAGRSRDERGRAGSLDPEGLKCFFDNVPSLLERLQALIAAGVLGAAGVLRSVASSLEFHNASVKAWIEHERDRQASDVSTTGASGAGPESGRTDEG